MAKKVEVTMGEQLTIVLHVIEDGEENEVIVLDQYYALRLVSEIVELLRVFAS